MIMHLCKRLWWRWRLGGSLYGDLIGKLAVINR